MLDTLPEAEVAAAADMQAELEEEEEEQQAGEATLAEGMVTAPEATEVAMAATEVMVDMEATEGMVDMEATADILTGTPATVDTAVDTVRADKALATKAKGTKTTDTAAGAKDMATVKAQEQMLAAADTRTTAAISNPPGLTAAIARIKSPQPPMQSPKTRKNKATPLIGF